MPKFSINGTIHFKDGDLRPTIFSIEAENKEEAKLFYSHGVHVNEVNGIPANATATLDFRTLKKVDKAQQIVNALRSSYNVAKMNFDLYDKEANDLFKAEGYRIQCGRKRDVYEREKAIWSNAVNVAEKIIEG